MAKSMVATQEMGAGWRMPQVDVDPLVEEALFDPIQLYQNQVGIEQKLHIRYGQAHIARVHEHFYV